MALPRDDSVFSGHIFNSVGTLGRYVNSAAAIVATAASTGLVKMHFTACKKGAATERARVHLCHAVPRVTVSCRPLYLLIIIGLRTINDANYSFLLIAYTAVHDTSRYTSAQHTKRKKAVRDPPAPSALPLLPLLLPLPIPSLLRSIGFARIVLRVCVGAHTRSTG